MPPDRLTCRHLQPGDVLLKLGAGSASNTVIALAQRAVGDEFSEIVHAGVLFDPHYMIESSGGGLGANDLRVQNARFEYVVFRCTNPAIAAGAATYAKVLLDIHAAQRSVSYSFLGAFSSLFKGQGKARSRGSMDDRLDAMLQGIDRPNFCSQLVIAVYQFAAEQNGKAASTVFDSCDIVPPSRLMSMLRRTQSFRQVGYLAAGVR